MSVLKLWNGYKMPLLGLGTFRSKDGDVSLSLGTAFKLGYSHIDCGWIYRNEKEIGDYLNSEIKSGKIKREDFFLTTKLWNSYHRPEKVQEGFQESLNNLQLDYIDLYLIHWPMSTKPGILFPTEATVKDDLDDVDLLETWKAMEKLVDSGKVKSIGVSNFNTKQVQRILDNCRIKPAVNQVEVHVYYPNKKIIKFCQQNGVQVAAYSPLGGQIVEDQKKPLEDPDVLRIAKKLSVTPAQILINYITRQNVACVPKTVSPSRLEENMKALDIKMSDEDFNILNNLKINNKMCVLKIFEAHKEYPFLGD